MKSTANSAAANFRGIQKRNSPSLTTLSFVVPVYGSPESLQPLYDRVRLVCAEAGLSHELILVDDCCPRNSWAVVKRIAEDDPSVTGVRLSRNFGQHAAIQAGLSLAKGEWIVVMDCDLQDRPEEVPALLAKAQEGFEIVRAKRVERNDPWTRRIASRFFYALLSFLTNTQQSADVANFGVYSSRVIAEILAWQESSKYFPAIVPWIGFAQVEIPVGHDSRFSGHSSYNIKKLFNLAIDLIVGFSDKPLTLVMAGGLAMAVASFCVAFAVVVLHVVGFITVQGWTSIVLSLWFLSGCLLFALGLVGLYVGRILVETKGRPTFIIDSIVSSERK
jgi:glycosyltransferase involved in cell wall biosynthesis